jgi:hypothetical protein
MRSKSKEDDKMASKAQTEAVKRYQDKTTRLMSIRLNLNTDADIIQKLGEVGSKQGYIKELIRKDMAAE